jgi:hypothetical protein
MTCVRRVMVAVLMVNTPGSRLRKRMIIPNRPRNLRHGPLTCSVRFL